VKYLKELGFDVARMISDCRGSTRRGSTAHLQKGEGSTGAVLVGVVLPTSKSQGVYWGSSTRRALEEPSHMIVVFCVLTQKTTVTCETRGLVGATSASTSPSEPSTFGCGEY